MAQFGPLLPAYKLLDSSQGLPPAYPDLSSNLYAGNKVLIYTISVVLLGLGSFVGLLVVLLGAF